MSITFKNTKRGMSINAKGKDADALFKAMTRDRPEEKVKGWNESVKVGQEVDYRGFPEDAPQRFKTRTPAEVLSGHTAVVWLDGKGGCVSLEACTPVVTPVPEGGAA